MTAKLTKKQKIFVDEYIATGNGTQSALKAYDTDAPTVANAIAVENLQKPLIQNALIDLLDDDLLGEVHREMLKQVRLEYFVFPKSMSDEEIKSHVEAQGLTVINVRPSEKGKLAFFSLPDAHARGKALELAYKIKGTFAPEKRVVAVITEPSDKIKELARKLNQ